MFLTVCIYERELSVLGCFLSFQEAQNCMIDDMCEVEDATRDDIINHECDCDDFEFNGNFGWSNKGGNNIDWNIIDIDEERRKTQGLKENDIKIIF